ncbi:MAG: adenylyl-sulfate kinase [Chitinophagales bacterium]
MIADAFLKIFENDPTVKRHLLKTLSWRIVGTLDTVLLGWFITGQLNIGAEIGGLELVTKMVLYFTHERAWHRVNFGIPSRFNKAEKVKRENISKLFLQNSKIGRKQREEQNANKSFTIWLTGLPASGKSTIAAELESWFFSKGLRSYVIDGDNTRLGINSDLSFSKEDRGENIRRVAEICRLFNEAGTIVIASFISPFEEDRMMAKNIIGTASFIETFVDASLSTCKARDAKGLYKLAEEGKIKNFTGINSPYEKPVAPAIHIHTDTEPLHTSVSHIINYLNVQNIISLQPAQQLP